MAIAQKHFEVVLEDIGQGVYPAIVSHNAIPLFTNKLIGLKRVERNRTSQVNLVEYSWNRDKEGDSMSEHTIEEDDPNDDSSDSSGSSGADGPTNQGNGNAEGPNQEEGINYLQQNPSSNNNIQGPESSKRKRDCDHDQGHRQKRARTSNFKIQVQATSQRRKEKKVKPHDDIASFKARSTIQVQIKKTKDQGKALLSFTPHPPKRKLCPTGSVINEEIEAVRRKKKRRRELNAQGSPNYHHGETSQNLTGKFFILAACVTIIGNYNTTPSSHTKGSNVILYSKFSKKYPDFFFQTALTVFLLTCLARKRNWPANSLTPVHLNSPNFFYLYLIYLKSLVLQNLISKTPSKQTKMANKTKIHPSPSSALNGITSQNHQLDFFPPYEEVNLADLFNNVQISESDRLMVRNDPFNDFFIPFGSIPYFEPISTPHSPPFEVEPLLEEALLYKNPPN